MDKTKANKLLKKVVVDYDSIADEFDKTRKNSWKEFEIFLPFIKNEDKLCDIGCGNGRFLDFIKKYKKIDYVGIDKSKKLLEKAKKAHPNTRFISGDMLKIPLQSEACDVAVCIASLHHIPGKELKTQALSELERILKRNGILLLTVWNLYQKKYEKYIGTDDKHGEKDAFIPWKNSKINRYYYAFEFDELKGMLIEKFNMLQSHKGNNLVFICKKK